MQNDTNELLYKFTLNCFIGTWIVLGVGGFFVFHFGKNAAFKKKWFPRFAICAGILFIFFSCTINFLGTRSIGSLRDFVFLVPAIVLIIYLGIKTTKFCDECGATLYRRNWFSPMKFCSKCGAALDAKPED